MENLISKLNFQTTKRMGLFSAWGIGVGYILVTILYVFAGNVPNEAKLGLLYFGDKDIIWWWIIVLSVVTDLLFIPLSICLYQLLKKKASAWLPDLALIFMSAFVFWTYLSPGLTT